MKPVVDVIANLASNQYPVQHSFSLVIDYKETEIQVNFSSDNEVNITIEEVKYSMISGNEEVDRHISLVHKAAEKAKNMYERLPKGAEEIGGLLGVSDLMWTIVVGKAMKGEL